MSVVVAILLLAAFAYFAGPELLQMGRAAADRLPLIRAVPQRVWTSLVVALGVFFVVLVFLGLAWGKRHLDDAFAVGLILATIAGASYLFGPPLWRWARRNPRAVLRLLGTLFAVVAFVFFVASLERGNEEAVIGLLIFGAASIGVFWYSGGGRPSPALARVSDRVRQRAGALWSSAAAKRQSPCPPLSQLKDMLAERLMPRDHLRLSAHLEHCAACQHRVEGLTAGQESWVGFARNLGQQPPAAPALRRVMDSLKESDKQEPTSDIPAFAGDLPLGFLSPPDKPEQLGRLERYEVLEEVGRGGMGVVLKAFDPSLHRVVAIKVLAPQLATSGVARKRFLREAKAAAAVTHDHIVTIHAVDEANGLPYLVMQYVPGLSLQDRIDKDGPLGDLAEILRIGIQTASGLAAAHGHGIVHRDVKPANILLEEGVGRVKITDFGLARAMDDASLTQSGLVAGSPLYMAPEQARGESLDHRADLFSLGSVLYTACTGRPPFRAANTLAVLRRVAEHDPRPIRETNPEVPDLLAEVVSKLMAKEPGERYQSAEEVVEVLSRHLAELQHGAPLPRPAAPPVKVKEELPGSNDLPTSVTICPSCGASLHVPDRMLGDTVHCGECGAPFRPEDGSEEILVARAVPTPFGRRPWWGWKWAKRVLFAGAGLAALVVLAIVVAESGPPAQNQRPAVAVSASGKTAVVDRRDGAKVDTSRFWEKGTLAVFPAEASLFGAIDFRAFGSLSLGDEWAQAALGLLLPPGIVRGLTPEKLGRLRLDGASLAYYENDKPEQSRAFVQVEGLALDGRRRAVDSLRRSAGGQVRIDEDRKGSTADSLVRVSGTDVPFAVGLRDDRRVFLARSMSPEAGEEQHLEAMEFLPWFDRSVSPRPKGDILTGYNPPWVKLALQEMPANACALLLGEIPADWRKPLTESLGLRVCPRTFVLHLRRDGEAVLLSVSLTTDRAGAEVVLKDDLEKWRHKGIDTVKAQFPGVRKEPDSLGRLGQLLNSLRWETKPGSLRGQVRISGSAGKALRALAHRAAEFHDEAPQE